MAELYGNSGGKGNDMTLPDIAKVREGKTV